MRLPTPSAASVNTKAGSPKFSERSTLTADRRSVMSTARTMLVPGVGLGVLKTAEKIADTDCIEVTDSTQFPVPLQPPPTHPLNDAEDPALAAKVTLVPLV